VLSSISIFHIHWASHIIHIMHVILSTYKAIVLSKLLYASPAWWRFTSAADEQRLEARTRSAVRAACTRPTILRF